MATYPSDPNLPAVTNTTRVDADFLNTLVDNINAIANNLGDLTNNTADGNIDLATDKGIEWGDSLTIYLSGGVIIIDGAVTITEALIVTGNSTIDGILNVDTINDSGQGYIDIVDDMEMAAGKYIKSEEFIAKEINTDWSAGITLEAGNGVRLSAAGSVNKAWLEYDESPSDPAAPAADKSRLWIDSDGDFVITINHGGVTRSKILADFSAM